MLGLFKLRRLALWVAVWGTYQVAAPASGQSLPRFPGQAGDTVDVVPGSIYAGSGFRELVLGSHYRDLWTTPIRVPVLDLGAFAGGLTPTRSHVGSQTTSLRFAGADGRTYQFRSVFKTPAAGLAEGLQGTVVADVLQDGASASHPLGSMVVAPLLAAAGVLHAPPVLRVMPDDPGLGEFQNDFAGVLGWVEERPDEADDEGRGGFGVALRVISPTRLFERIDEGPEDQVDVRAFLVARLVDILIGDRDRHRDNWRWALLDESGPVRYWQPISRDHDEAFVKLDGLALRIATVYYPQLTSFDIEFDNTLNLNWHSREIDRRFLAGVDRAQWAEAVESVQGALSDDVIEGAVGRMPPEMVRKRGAWLIRALKSRRDALPDEVDRYYRILSREVEVHGTNAGERAEVIREGGALRVRIQADGFAEPWFDRRFDPGETQEVRLAMWGGRDTVLVSGDGDATIKVRVVGGSGRDLFVDSTSSGNVVFYDSGDRSTFVTQPDTRTDRRAYPEWIGSDTVRYPPRDWGAWTRPLPFVGAGPDFGILLGLGVQRTRYGFRKAPYSSDVTARAAVSTGDGWGVVDLSGDFRFENRSTHVEVDARSSGIDLLHFFGLGNNTSAAGGTAFHEVEVNVTSIHPRLVVPLGSAALSVGPTFRRTSTETEGARFFEALADTVYGGGTFSSFGGVLALELETTSAAPGPPRDASISVSGTWFPALGDVASSYGRITAEAGATWGLGSGSARLPSVSVRGGGIWLAGRFPFQDAAFLGGNDNLRGWTSDRFAGDRALYGSVELSQPLGAFSLMLPGELGLTLLADVGRTYVDGASPGGWHSGFGGGLWFAFLDRRNAISLSVVRGDERTAIYTSFGFR